MVYKSISCESFFRSFIGVCFTLIIAILSVSAVYAETIDSSYEIGIAKAISKIESDDFKGAIDVLREILRLKPEDERATLYLGIALSRSGNRDAERILKKALLMNPENPRTNLELGIYYFNRGIHGEAADYFDNTIQIASSSEFAEKAVEYLKLVKPEHVEKRWALNFSTGGQYDSNVVLDSDDNPLPEGVSRKSDWRAVFYLKGLYKFISKAKFEGLASYNFYQSLHTSLSDFNITSNQFDLVLAYRVSPNLSIKGEYMFEYILVGGDPYSYAHYISPILVISEGGGFATELQYTYMDGHYRDSDLFVDNSVRTGFNNLFRITQTVPIADTATLQVGYSYDADKTEASYWDYRGNKGLAELKLTLPCSIYIDLYGEYYVRDYRGIYPGMSKKRYDWISTGTISATKVLSEIFSVTLGQLYTNNKSSIDIYDYDRAITSLFVNVRF